MDPLLTPQQAAGGGDLASMITQIISQMALQQQQGQSSLLEHAAGAPQRALQVGKGLGLAEFGGRDIAGQNVAAIHGAASPVGRRAGLQSSIRRQKLLEPHATPLPEKGEGPEDYTARVERKKTAGNYRSALRAVNISPSAYWVPKPKDGESVIEYVNRVKREEHSKTRSVDDYRKARRGDKPWSIEYAAREQGIQPKPRPTGAEAQNMVDRFRRLEKPDPMDPNEMAVWKAVQKAYFSGAPDIGTPYGQLKVDWPDEQPIPGELYGGRWSGRHGSPEVQKESFLPLSMEDQRRKIIESLAG